MKKIVIIGTGGNCIDILNTLLDLNDARGEKVYDCIGFLDDNPERWSKNIHNINVLGPLQMARELNDSSFIFGIGSTSSFLKRRSIITRLGIEEDRFETIIHPSTFISRMATVGQGTVILQNVTVNSDAIIGKFVYLLPNSVISHNSIIGEFSCIASGVCVSGNVQIRQCCYIGTNSSIKEGVEIEERSLIGMGSVVLRNVPANSVVAGNPARFLRKT